MIRQISNFPVRILDRENFPPLLASAFESSRPTTLPRLYFRGSLPNFQSSWIAMVGTRRPSAFAQDICRRLVENLRGTDAVVVSGLAQGIDSFCHLAAIEKGIPTVAVIAQGIEAPIGGSRRDLALKILEAGGAILSEYPDKNPPLKFMFPARNRIIAGLCKSTTLVESKPHGGGLITVKAAQTFRRKILAVPGNLLFETSQGPNLCAASRVAEPVWQFSNFGEQCGAQRLSDISSENSAMGGIELPDSAKKFFKENAGFTHSLDSLCTRSSLPVSAVLAILTELEIAGLVHSDDGNAFHFSKESSLAC